MTKPVVIVALDYDEADSALAFAKKVDPTLCRLKVGNELFTTAGPKLVEQLQAKGFSIFLDLKFHDIPNTVARAVSAAAKLGVWMVNVHASGGEVMMQAAAEALGKFRERPLLIAVTVLTSMDQDQLSGIGLNISPLEQVQRLCALAKKCGLDGTVSSAREVKAVKKICQDNFICVTPGIRPAGSALGDQKRVMTPAMAMKEGADYLVIGRPITQAADPLKTLLDINAELYQTAP